MRKRVLMTYEEAVDYFSSMPEHSLETQQFIYAVSMLSDALLVLGCNKGALTEIEHFILNMQEKAGEEQTFQQVCKLGLCIGASIQQKWDAAEENKGEHKLWN